MRTALIVGLSGAALTCDDRAFLAEARPAGIILFARNCVQPVQVRALVEDARAAIAADDLLVLIDQEGGRVRRLRPPHWRELPAAAAFTALTRDAPPTGIAAARLAARLTAQDLREIGVNTNCAPVLDLKIAGAHDIIGDRAYGETPEEVAILGRAVAEGLMDGGVVPVIKHIPGHGRALADSHFELPVVDTDQDELERTDFAPFRALADMPAAMTAHVVYSRIDADRPASTSAQVTSQVIRGHIGFSGLLMSDDLGMRALTGSFRERAEAVIRAGSDVALHCSGDLVEMRAVAEGCPTLGGLALQRFAACCAITQHVSAFDVAAAENAIAAAVRVV